MMGALSPLRGKRVGGGTMVTAPAAVRPVAYASISPVRCFIANRHSCDFFFVLNARPPTSSPFSYRNRSPATFYREKRCITCGAAFFMVVSRRLLPFRSLYERLMSCPVTRVLFAR
jgi:hypothetical protein